ncbi:MAG: InlB B-repeat-containing protein, partial [Erysipelotrichaceae bacterium]
RYTDDSTNSKIMEFPAWVILADEPSDPTRDGYVFDGWYYDLGGESEFLWTFDEDEYNDDTVSAKWTAAVPNTGDIAGLSSGLLGLGSLLVMATKRRRF